MPGIPNAENSAERSSAMKSIQPKQNTLNRTEQNRTEQTITQQIRTEQNTSRPEQAITDRMPYWGCLTEMVVNMNKGLCMLFHLETHVVATAEAGISQLVHCTT